jgi:hypothetical protein
VSYCQAAKPDKCYLCGDELCDPIDWDHVPPRQFYAPIIRKAHNPQLLTIPVHARCNKKFQLDEDYFTQTILPFAHGSYAGDALYARAMDNFKNNKNVGLARKVLKEFEPRPSGIVLPQHKVAKRFDSNRMSRVVWKIVRGLYYHHNNMILTEDLRRQITITLPPEAPPEHFLLFLGLPDNPSLGQHQGVFAYRFQKFSDDHYWALLF